METQNPPADGLPSFWSGLSKVPLVPQALHEFNRRTERLSAPSRPPDLSLLQKHHRAQLKRFARLGGANLDDIRAFRRRGTDHRIGSRSGAASADQGSTPDPVIRPSNAAFQQHLVDHVIAPSTYPHLHPDNLADIQERLARRRSSVASFTTEKFEYYRSDDFAFIIGSAEFTHGGWGCVPFENLKALTNDSLYIEPAFFDGSDPEELDWHVRRKLDAYITPSMHQDLCLPNFFAEVPGPRGNSTGDYTEARRKVSYEGALSARGIHQLRLHNDPEATFDHKAYTITCTFNTNGHLTLYTYHPVQSNDSPYQIRYHETMLAEWLLTGDFDQFRQGITAFRNAREWAEEQRDELIAAANRRAEG